MTWRSRDDNFVERGSLLVPRGLVTRESLLTARNDPRLGGEDCTPSAAGAGAYATWLLPITQGQVPCLLPNCPPPNMLWRSQDSATGLVDSIQGLTLTGVGAVDYGQAVTDWSLNPRWARVASETANQGFYIDKDTAVPRPGPYLPAQSMVLVSVQCVTSCTGTRIGWVLAGTSPTSVFISMNASGQYILNRGGTASTATANGYEQATPTPHVLGFEYDHDAQEIEMHVKRQGQSLESKSVAYAAHVGGGFGYNIDVGSIPPVTLLNMIYLWVGRRAEAFRALGGTPALISAMGV